MITVQVFGQQSGQPQGSQLVVVYPNSSGGGYSEYTNAQGEAHFAQLDPGTYEVSVDGSTVYKGQISGKQIVYA